MIRTVACPAFLFVIVLFSWAQTGPALEERLAAHRNLGKAFYENPTTQVQSVDEFSKALALSPKSVRERVNYGLALLRAAKTDEGIAHLKLAQAADAGLPQTWFNLGIQYKRRGETAPALEQLRKARELAPRDAIIHYNIAVLEKMDGVLDRAIAGFEKASLLDPNLAAPHFQLFNALRQNEIGRASCRERMSLVV